jgi:hypothetical protein
LPGCNQLKRKILQFSSGHGCFVLNLLIIKINFLFSQRGVPGVVMVICLDNQYCGYILMYFLLSCHFYPGQSGEGFIEIVCPGMLQFGLFLTVWRE